MRTLHSSDQFDKNYRRMWYCRYADDMVVGIIGTRQNAQKIMEKVITFLKEELHLECAPDKTMIRHAKDKGVTFLGYDIKVYDGHKTIKKCKDGRHFLWRSVRSQIQLSVPLKKVHAFCKKNRYGDLQRLKFHHRRELVNQSDYEILMTYNAELRGLANYYILAWDVKQKLNTLFYTAQYSLLKTSPTSINVINAIFSRGTARKSVYHIPVVEKEKSPLFFGSETSKQTGNLNRWLI